MTITHGTVFLLAGGLLASVAALNYLAKNKGIGVSRLSTAPLLAAMAVISSVVLTLFNVLY